IPFTDTNELKSATEIFPGAATVATTLSEGSLELRAILANFGTETRTTTVLMSSNDAQKILRTLAVPPHSISAAQAIDLPANTGGSLIVQTNAAPGELLAAIQAVGASRSSSLSIPLPWKDERQIPNGGQHPWRIDGPFRSTIMLYNPDAQQ